MAENSAPTAAAPRSSSSATTVTSVLLIAAVLTAGWFWHRSTSAQNTPTATAPRTVLHLESFIVNLTTLGDNGYLRVGIDLGLDVELKDGSERAAYLGRLRDAILTVLGSRNIDDLLTAEGKVRLKKDLLAAINEHVPEVHCREVYFTEFLVQH